MDPPARVLGIGGAAGTVESALGRLDDSVDHTVAGATAGIERAQDGEYECVVLSPYIEVGGDGPVEDRLRTVEPDLPIVALIRSQDCERADDILAHDATDVVVADRCESKPGILSTRVENAVRRYRNERTLEEYETLVRALPDEVYTLDAEGIITSILPPTDQERTTTGYRPEELEGKPIDVLMEDDDVDFGKQLIVDLLTSERDHASFEMDVIARDGTRLPRENHVALLPMDEDEEFRGTVGVLRDITERRERERELERQNERLEQFAHIASHDLRNPLNVAKGRLTLAQEDVESDHLDHVQRALDRMETMVDDTLTMAKEGQSVTAVEAVDLAEMATRCWTAVPNAAARLEVDDRLTVQADPERLSRVLENLFRNAVEHGGSSVTIRVGAVADDGFYVADDGAGIPEAERDEVFGAGHSTADDGTGFGLTIVEQIVEAHGWTIGVCESEGGGTRFEITGVDVE